jgi:L-rhamnose mutarotase
MTQVAFKMQLKPGFENEYRKRHDEIWPELKEALTNAGVYDYAIYLDEKTHTLFAVQKLKDGETSADLPNNPIVRKWWDYMADIMETHQDKTPVVTELKEVFYMA